MIRKNKNNKFINALDAEKLKSFIDDQNHEVIASIDHDIGNYIFFWMGMPTIERIKRIRDTYKYLGIFIDFDIVLSRIENIEMINIKKDDFIGNIIGIHISKIFPELSTVRDACAAHIEKLPKSIEKAELRLYPIAVAAGANADLEALIYFASRGQKLVDSQDIKEIWHSAICYDIINGRPIGKPPEDVLNRAKSQTISLIEAAEVLKFNNNLSRFFSFRDEEEDFIDSTFFRAVEWLDIKGFEPWIDSFASDMSVVTQYGYDLRQHAWNMFYWCRSDLAIRKTNKVGLESALWALINGQIDKDKPWKTTRSAKEIVEYVDYIPIAGSILFSWQRIRPNNLDSKILAKATELLYQTQMNSGAWPITSNDSEGSIIATCFAIHGLALYKPSGWLEVTKRAAKWLIEKQEQSGIWYISGGPTIMLTVLALDSINLGQNKKKVTFKHATSKKIVEKIYYEPKYDFSKELWYVVPLPKTISKSQKAVAKINPKIALIVAVEIELKEVLKKLKPLKGENKIWKVNISSETYYLGRFGKHIVVVLMSGMGSQGPSGSTLSTEVLIQEWNPGVIILLGIAFGANRNKHKSGDILVAEHIIPYEAQRVGKKIQFRNQIPNSSFTLINRIRNNFGWNFTRPDKTKVNKYIGAMLSGEKLVDNVKFKEVLLKQYPHAIGGEMEGSGLWASAARNNKDWILIKGVADWGDGKKHKEYQQFAAASSVSFCEHLIKEPYFLQGIK